MLEENHLRKKIEELKKILEKEAEKYYCVDKSKMAEKIGNYQVCFMTIDHFAEKNDFKAITLVFQKFSLNINTLVKCFKEKVTRNNVRIVYKSICEIILEKLKEINN